MEVRLLRWCLLPSAALLLTGCPTTNAFTTARTLEPQKLQQQAMIEVHSITVEDTCDPSVDPVCDPTTDDLFSGFIGIPTVSYALRYGIADHVELGGKFSSFGTAQVDLKLQLVRTDPFDLAVMPTFSFTTLFSYVTLPVLASLNLGTDVTITVGPKVGYLFTFENATSSSDFVDGVLLGVTTAIHFRVAERVSIAPGFDYQRLVADFTEATDPGIVFFSVGMSFSFGANPQYGEPVPEELPPPPQPQYYQQPQPYYPQQPYPPQPQQPHPYEQPTAPPGYGEPPQPQPVPPPPPP